MRQFERDWLELGSRVARSLHYQHDRNLRLLQATQADMKVMAKEPAEPALGDDDQARRRSNRSPAGPSMRRGGTQVACWRSIPSSKATIERR